MNNNFDVCLPWVLVHEGGYVDHPDDPGGATNRGVIQRTYNAYRKRSGLPLQPVRQITDAEVRAIYREQYWNVIRGDDLPAGLDYAVFDFAVNSGPSRAAKYLQRLVGARQDGVIGVETLAAIADSPKGAAELVVALCEARMAFLKRLRHWKTFGRGWTRRVMGDQDGIQMNDHGTVDRGVMLARQHPAEQIPAPAVVEDGAGARARGADISLRASVADAAKDLPALGTGVSVTGGLAAVSNLEGPIAWAVAAAVVIAAMGGLVWIVRRTRAV